MVTTTLPGSTFRKAEDMTVTRVVRCGLRPPVRAWVWVPAFLAGPEAWN
jgi:hypothetical protein